MLSLLASLPLPHQLGVDLARFTRTDHLSQRYAHDAVYPDCVALAFDEDHERITVIHSDHSIYVWDVRDAQQTTKLCSHLYHSRCVWGIEVSAWVNFSIVSAIKTISHLCRFTHRLMPQKAHFHCLLGRFSPVPVMTRFAFGTLPPLGTPVILLTEISFAPSLTKLSTVILACSIYATKKIIQVCNSLSEFLLLSNVFRTS